MDLHMLGLAGILPSQQDHLPFNSVTQTTFPYAFSR